MPNFMFIRQQSIQPIVLHQTPCSVTKEKQFCFENEKILRSADKFKADQAVREIVLDLDKSYDFIRLTQKSKTRTITGKENPRNVAPDKANRKIQRNKSFLFGTQPAPAIDYIIEEIVKPVQTKNSNNNIMATKNEIVPCKKNWMFNDEVRSLVYAHYNKLKVACQDFIIAEKFAYFEPSWITTDVHTYARKAIEMNNYKYRFQLKKPKSSPNLPILCDARTFYLDGMRSMSMLSLVSACVLLFHTYS